MRLQSDSFCISNGKEDDKNDKVNPTGQIDSDQRQHTKIHSILIVYLFILTGKHWNQQSKSYVHHLILIFIRVYRIGYMSCWKILCIPPSVSKFRPLIPVKNDQLVRCGDYFYSIFKVEIWPIKLQHISKDVEANILKKINKKQIEKCPELKNSIKKPDSPVRIGFYVHFVNI